MDRKNFLFTMDVEQQADDVRLDVDRQKLDHKNFIDDEVVTLLHHKRDMNVPDIPGSDIRDGLDTQREDGSRRITREREVREAGRWSNMDSGLLCCHPSDRS